MSDGLSVPNCVVDSLHHIVLRQQAEIDALVAENHRLQASAYNDHSARQFARSQLDEYRGFLCGVMEDEDVATELQRLGEFEEEDADNQSDGDGSEQDGLSDYSEYEEEAEMSG